MPFPTTSLGGQVYFYDDFLGAALQGAVAGTSENSGTAAIVVAQDGGVVGLVTGTTSGNRSAITTGLNHEAADGSIIGQFRIKPVSSVADVAYFVGFTDTVSLEFPIEISGTAITSNATDAAGLMFDTAATTDVWRAVAVAADVDATPVVVQLNGANAVPVADTYAQIRVVINPDGDAVFSYGLEDGNEEVQGFQEVARISGAVTAGTSLTPICIVETRTTAAKTLYVDALLIQSGRDGAL